MLQRLTRKKLIGMGVIVFVVVLALMWVNYKIAAVLQTM
jgi:hypothetical protein